MPRRTEVGLGPGHIVLHGAQLPSPQKGHSSRIFGLSLLWSNGRPSQLLLSTCVFSRNTSTQSYTAQLIATNRTVNTVGEQSYCTLANYQRTFLCSEVPNFMSWIYGAEACNVS